MTTTGVVDGDERISPEHVLDDSVNMLRELKRNCQAVRAVGTAGAIGVVLEELYRLRAQLESRSADKGRAPSDFANKEKVEAPPNVCGCGGAVSNVNANAARTLFVAFCGECGATGPERESRVAAIQAWNRSHSRPVTKAERNWLVDFRYRSKTYSLLWERELAAEIEARMANGAGSPSEGEESPHA